MTLCVAQMAKAQQKLVTKGQGSIRFMENNPAQKENIMGLTANIVSSHVANNKVEVAELPLLIESVFKALNGLNAKSKGMLEKPRPAVPVKKSILPDYIICLEDGKRLKMLKRHLKSQYGMTPEEYRERWGLPSDYPMVAPNYAEQRRFLAKQIGLGRGNKK